MVDYKKYIELKSQIEQDLDEINQEFKAATVALEAAQEVYNQAYAIRKSFNDAIALVNRIAPLDAEVAKKI